MISMVQAKAIHDNMSTQFQSQIKINETNQENAVKFKNLLMTQIEETNNLQYAADMELQGLLTGETENLHDVMIAMEESQIALEFLTQTRNRIVDAYQEIKNLQI